MISPRFDCQRKLTTAPRGLMLQDSASPEAICPRSRLCKRENCADS